MKLRWIRVCDKNGVWTEPELQYKDEDSDTWETVPTVARKEWETDEEAV